MRPDGKRYEDILILRFHFKNEQTCDVHIWVTAGLFLMASVLYFFAFQRYQEYRQIKLKNQPPPDGDTTIGGS